MPKISEPEYPELKAFFIAWEQEFPPHPSLPPEDHPVAVLNATEQQSRSRARLGLGMAINDILEESWSFPPDKVAEVEVLIFAADESLIHATEHLAMIDIDEFLQAVRSRFRVPETGLKFPMSQALPWLESTDVV